MSNFPFPRRFTAKFGVMEISFFALFGVFVLLIGAYVVGAVVVSGTANSCTVTSKEEIPSSKGRINYRIHATGCNGNPEEKIFAVEDALVEGEIDKAVIYHDQVAVGKTYDFETHGIAVPAIMMYENILKVTPAS